jgi:hypothetical protein
LLGLIWSIKLHIKIPNTTHVLAIIPILQTGHHLRKYSV